MHNENYISKFSETIYNLERREYWIVQSPAMQSGWWVSLAYKELNAGLLIGSTHQLKNAGADQ